MAAEGRALQCRDELGAVGARRTLERIRYEQDAGVIHVDFVGVELAFLLDLFPQGNRFCAARIEPVIAIHDVLRRLGEFLDELVGRCRPAEHGVYPFRPYALLLHGAGKQDVLVVIVRRDDKVGVLRPDLEGDVVEVPRRGWMRNGIEHLEAAPRQLVVEQFRQTRSEGRVLVNDHHRLCRLACLVVDGDEVVERSLGDHAEARSETERVLQPARHDGVDHAYVNHVGEVVTRGGLACRKANGAAVSADDRGNTG